MSGYSLPRVQFDYMMFKKATEIVKENGGSVIQGFTVKEILVKRLVEQQSSRESLESLGVPDRSPRYYRSSP